MLMPGDVVTVLFRYSDASGAKVRPALVVSAREFNQETRQVVLAAVSARPVRDRYDVALLHWEEAGLRFPSKVRSGKLLTADTALVRRIGRLACEETINALAKIKSVIAQPEITEE